MSNLSNEFALIEKYFKPLVEQGSPALSLASDTAQFSPEPGHDLVFTKDMMVEGVHFLPTVSPSKLAKKLLRVNLSDLAAAGAKPLGYLLGFGAIDNIGSAWLAAFSSGLAEDQLEYGISLWGGDTVNTKGPMVLSITAIGQVPKDKGLSRVGAKVGDTVYTTGIIGDGFLGLKALKSELHESLDTRPLIERLETPSPRLQVGMGLIDVANAMADVSDGLVADLNHVARASDVCIEINSDQIPFSKQGHYYAEMTDKGFANLITGGDDYELVFTASDEDSQSVINVSRETGIAITPIGKVCSGKGVRVLDEKGNEIILSQKGYNHFLD